MRSLLFLVCVLFVLTVDAQSSWAIVDQDYATFALSTSFQAPNQGWVAGGTASVQSLLLYTTDGGMTFNNTELVGNNDLAAWLCMDMCDSQNGVAGGFGFIGINSLAYTHDGQSWTSGGSELICAYTDADCSQGGDVLAITGIWSDRGDFLGNGVRLSSDGGQTWTENNWPPASTESSARYSFFFDATFGYVVGGSYPVTDSTVEGRIRQIHEFVSYDHEEKTFNVDFTPASDKSRETGYSGAITTFNGETFSVIFNSTGEYYFNEIWCTDTDTCWVTASGVNKTTLEPASWLFFTNDGFSSMSTQLYVPESTIVTVNMLNSTFGWAGGAVFGESGADFYGSFWQTTDGKTWNQSPDTLKNFFAWDISTVNEDYAYVAGLTSLGLSSFGSYAPSNYQ